MIEFPDNWDALNDDERKEIEDCFRWCVHCRADCWHTDVEHTADCPQNTGLYTVQGRDLGPLVHCPKCSHEWRLHGMLCMDCGEEFREGDSFVHRATADDVFEVVCVGCGALSAVDAE